MYIDVVNETPRTHSWFICHNHLGHHLRLSPGWHWVQKKNSSHGSWDCLRVTPSVDYIHLLSEKNDRDNLYFSSRCQFPYVVVCRYWMRGLHCCKSCSSHGKEVWEVIHPSVRFLQYVQEIDQVVSSCYRPGWSCGFNLEAFWWWTVEKFKYWVMLWQYVDHNLWMPVMFVEKWLIIFLRLQHDMTTLKGNISTFAHAIPSPNSTHTKRTVKVSLWSTSTTHWLFHACSCTMLQQVIVPSSTYTDPRSPLFVRIVTFSHRTFQLLPDKKATGQYAPKDHSTKYQYIGRSPWNTSILSISMYYSVPNSQKKITVTCSQCGHTFDPMGFNRHFRTSGCKKPHITIVNRATVEARMMADRYEFH